MQTIRQCAWLIKYLTLPLTETILVELVVGYLIFKEVTYLPTILWMNLLTNPMLNVLQRHEDFICFKCLFLYGRPILIRE